MSLRLLSLWHDGSIVGCSYSPGEPLVYRSMRFNRLISNIFVILYNVILFLSLQHFRSECFIRTANTVLSALFIISIQTSHVLHKYRPSIPCRMIFQALFVFFLSIKNHFFDRTRVTASLDCSVRFGLPTSTALFNSFNDPVQIRPPYGNKHREESRPVPSCIVNSTLGQISGALLFILTSVSGWRNAVTCVYLL